MSKSKKEMEVEKEKEIGIGDSVKITLGGCSINGKTGEIVDVEEYGYKTIYNVLIDGKKHRVNARFCQLVEKTEPEEKEYPEEVEEPIENNGVNENEH